MKIIILNINIGHFMHGKTDPPHKIMFSLALSFSKNVKLLLHTAIATNHLHLIGFLNILCFTFLDMAFT